MSHVNEKRSNISAGNKISDLIWQLTVDVPVVSTLQLGSFDIDSNVQRCGVTFNTFTATTHLEHSFSTLHLGFFFD